MLISGISLSGFEARCRAPLLAMRPRWGGLLTAEARRSAEVAQRRGQALGRRRPGDRVRAHSVRFRACDTIWFKLRWGSVRPRQRRDLNWIRWKTSRNGGSFSVITDIKQNRDVTLSNDVPPGRLVQLKRARFTPDGKQERVERSLAALNQPAGIQLSPAEWKGIIEDSDLEDQF